MKFLTTFIFSLLLFGSVFSQELDTRLLEKYSETELTEMQSNSPQEFTLLNYALDNAIYYADYPEEKGGTFQSIAEPEAGATFLSLGLKIKDQNQYFRIESSRKLLVVKSTLVLTYEMKNK